MGGEAQLAGVAESRAMLLDEIGSGHDLVLVRGPGNIGDDLIRAGTGNLLDAHIYREIDVEELPSTSGDTALLLGGGAWCRSYHDVMPRALAIAELRFDRVIVLPSSFDVGEDSVRRALQRTEATIFAREPESYAAIAGLCRACAAHDCAFFFDFSGFRDDGTGTLNAFRTDHEATGGELLVPDNDDISITCSGLEAWLHAIACHATVRTDRAHVMLAAALMGKEVEFAPSNYHKLESIVEGCLQAFPVRRIPAPRSSSAAGARNGRPPAPVYERLRRSVAPLPAATGPSVGRPSVVRPSVGGPSVAEPARITAAILSHDRPDLVAAAVRSVTASTAPVAVLVIDNNSGVPTRRALTALAAEDPRIELRLADRNLGCARARQLAVELVETELILFLDDDAELMPGALEHLLADLDAHPDAAGVTGLVVARDGTVHHYGGWIVISEEKAWFTLGGTGLPFDDPGLPPTGPSGWVPGTAALLRVETLRAFPIDPEIAAYYEDADWCQRVDQARPGSFRRCREARVLHHQVDRDRAMPRFVACSQTAEKLLTQAHFLHVHGRLLDVDLGELVPELRLPDGSIDTTAARLLLELIAARGSDWGTMALLNGELEPLLGRARLEAELERQQAQTREREAALEQERAAVALLEQRHETLLRIEAGGWWRLRSRLLPVLRLLSAARDIASSRT